jgi:hypothetical protein
MPAPGKPAGWPDRGGGIMVHRLPLKGIGKKY